MIETDCRHAVEMGLGGKLIIHPAQLAPARHGFAPSEDEVAWARRVIAAAQKANGGVVVQLDGTMIDAPVITRARQILVRSGATA